MTDTRTALKGLGLEENGVSEKVSNTDDFKKFSEIMDDKSTSLKKKRGRPTKSHVVTKLHLILEGRNLSRKDLYDLIKEKYPDEPISPDAVSRIVSGQRKHYSTTTLFRICGALRITPNQALDYELETI